MTRQSQPRRSIAAALVTLGLLATGCEFDGAYDLPLPGSPVDEDDAIEVVAYFDDILNIVPRSPVQVDDVVVGEVREVDRDGWNAKVTMLIRKDVVLPDNAIADVRQVSLLGEKYVAVEPPPTGASQERLEDGDEIPLERTGRNPEVEEVLGALSFLLSGGGVEQLAVISHELNLVMTGRTDRLRSLMGVLDDVVGTLDDQRADIVAAMESVNNLARTLNAERDTLDAALEAMPPAITVLQRQHAALVRMLDSLDRLGRVGTRVMRASRENLVKDLRHLAPILRKFNEAKDSLPRGLSLMISFPFPDTAKDIIKGDYANALFNVRISLRDMGGFNPGEPALPLPEIPALPIPDVDVPQLPGTDDPGGGGLPDLPGLPGGRVSQSNLVTSEGGLLGRGLG